jgi:hypothetical protein
MNRPALVQVVAVRQAASMSRFGPLPGAMIGLAVLWFAIWLYGCVKFYRRQANASS